jgi:hypothetical protein
MVNEIKLMIKEKIGIPAEGVKEIKYGQDAVHKLLLLFNIESCTNSKAYRFPFDLYKNESWDIEHIAPKTENSLQKTSDKIKWLKFVKTIVCKNSQWAELQKKAIELLDKLEKTEKDTNDEFKNMYTEIVNMVDSEDKDSIENKDLIGNLTLLDPNTNRGYGNALFQSKRQVILEKDMNGFFIPPSTKNIFLKYYTSENSNSQWKNTWSQPDADSYVEKMIDIIKFFLK